MTAGRDVLFDADRFDAALPERSDALAMFRDALRAGRAELKRRFSDKPDAVRLVADHAWLVDQLLVRAWEIHLPRLGGVRDIALVAVGGYGRGELHPHSDIDLMLLLEKTSPDRLRNFIEPLVRFLWDMGLEVGHSVRTLKDCAREAKRDITIATNLMESRRLWGDEGLVERMRSITHATRMWPSKKFFAAKWEEQRERHLRFDDTAYNLEPDVKDGPGGLRDIQMISWVTQRHFDTTSLHDLVELEFLTEEEYRTLIRGRNFLWRVRAGLHFLAGRREDRLLFDHQRALASQFGYKERRGALAVERFMKHYYRTIKELSLLNEILLQHCQEEILSSWRTRVRPINRRFQSRGGFLEVTHPRVFERTPFAMLELFHVLQQQPKLKGVRAQTIRLLRANLHRIDSTFRNDLAARSLFMEIVKSPTGLTHALRRMNAYGVLGAYLTPFGRVVGQMQHDLFHVYTVDQHTLFVVRNLRRFTVPQFRHEFPMASNIIQHLVKPYRLYIAGLFHDIAKGRGGDHSTLGEQEAHAFCRHHGLSDYDTRFIGWLVRWHLLMSQTAQREDIFDPQVVQRFAEKVGDKEHLDNLYLLTVADMRGTSPKVWNVWKDRLLSQLYSAALRELRRGFTQPLDVEQRINDLRTEAMQRLKRRGVPGHLVEAHWERMEREYFLRHDAESLAWHAEEIARTHASELPLVAVRYHPEAGGTEILVYTPDREGLFADITGAIDRLNLSIWDARIHTTRFGFALDTFVVLDRAGEAVADARALTQLQKALRALLLTPQPGRDWRTAHLPRVLKHFPIQTRVSFSASPDGQLTIMEVTAQDRPGLLYQVALTLVHCGARLVTARVATYGERAEDLFFVTDRARQPITDPAQRQCLEREISERLGIGATETSDMSHGAEI